MVFQIHRWCFGGAVRNPTIPTLHRFVFLSPTTSSLSTVLLPLHFSFLFKVPGGVESYTFSWLQKKRKENETHCMQLLSHAGAIRFQQVKTEWEIISDFLSVCAVSLLGFPEEKFHGKRRE